MITFAFEEIAPPLLDGSRTIPHNPTEEMAHCFREIHAFLNTALFDGKLPPTWIVFKNVANSLGHYSADKCFHRSDGTLFDEISLNPRHFSNQDDREILSTFAHEMVHQFQCKFGKPGKGHNAQWAAMMKAIGLYPSNTGKPGGKETGSRMSHYIIAGGAYDSWFQDWEKKGGKVIYAEVPRDEAKAKKKDDSKTKSSCPICSQNAWSKKGYAPYCPDCLEKFFSEYPEALLQLRNFKMIQ